MASSACFDSDALEADAFEADSALDTDARKADKLEVDDANAPRSENIDDESFEVEDNGGALVMMMTDDVVVVFDDKLVAFCDVVVDFDDTLVAVDELDDVVEVGNVNGNWFNQAVRVRSQSEAAMELVSAQASALELDADELLVVLLDDEVDEDV